MKMKQPSSVLRLDKKTHTKLGSGRRWCKMRKKESRTGRKCATVSCWCGWNKKSALCFTLKIVKQSRVWGGGEKTVCFYFMWCVCNYRHGQGEEEARMDGGTQGGVGLKVS